MIFPGRANQCPDAPNQLTREASSRIEDNKSDFKSEKKSYFTRDLAEKDKAPERGAVWPEDFSCSEKRDRFEKRKKPESREK